MILLTNTRHSLVGLAGYGLAIVERAADPRWRVEPMSTILLVEARFYAHLNDMLLDGARAAIEAAGHKHETMTVPGALEIPGAIALAAEAGASRLRRARRGDPRRDLSFRNRRRTKARAASWR